MIKLANDWCIDSDEMSFILTKDDGRTRAKKGRDVKVRKIYGYYPTLRSAVQAYRDMLIKSRISAEDMTLDEAIKMMREEDAKVAAMISGETKVANDE